MVVLSEDIWYLVLLRYLKKAFRKDIRKLIQIPFPYLKSLSKYENIRKGIRFANITFDTVEECFKFKDILNAGIYPNKNNDCPYHPNQNDRPYKISCYTGGGMHRYYLTQVENDKFF